MRKIKDVLRVTTPEPAEKPTQSHWYRSMSKTAWLC